MELRSTVLLIVYKMKTKKIESSICFIDLFYEQALLISSATNWTKQRRRETIRRHGVTGHSIAALLRRQARQCRAETTRTRTRRPRGNPPPCGNRYYQYQLPQQQHRYRYHCTVVVLPRVGLHGPLMLRIMDMHKLMPCRP